MFLIYPNTRVDSENSSLAVNAATRQQGGSKYILIADLLVDRPVCDSHYPNDDNDLGEHVLSSNTTKEFLGSNKNCVLDNILLILIQMRAWI